MRKATVLYKGDLAGTLTQHDDGSYTFVYQSEWVDNADKPQISLTLPKTHQEYHSEYLFPFFYNILPEGTNKQMVCKQHRIDYDDYFSLLLITAQSDAIGAVQIVKLNTDGTS